MFARFNSKSLKDDSHKRADEVCALLLCRRGKS